MALSGNFSGSTGNQYIYPEIYWSAVQSVDGNYSDVTATLYYSRSNSGYTTTGTWSGGITINGSRTSGSRYLSISYHSETMAISATVRVYHDADGSKAITISADGAINGTSLSSTSISAAITLDTIPRATTPGLSASSVDMGSKVTINLPRASSSFTHKLWYRPSGGAWVVIADDVATSYVWTVPDLATSIPNATGLKLEVDVETFSGSTKIGEKSVYMTATVPTSVVPAISSIAASEATSGLAAKFGAFVQGKSALNVVVTASGAKGSTITKYETVIQSVLYKDASFTSGIITDSGTISIATTVTDSRGRTAKLTKNVTVLPYSPPAINSFSAWRITSNGAASDDGNRVAVKMNYAVASVGGKNDRTYRLKYKKSGDESFTQFASGTASTAYDNTQSFTSAPNISVDYAYVIRLEIADYFQTVAHEVQIPTAFTIMDFRNTGRGMAIGKVSEKDALEVAMDAEFTGDVEFSGVVTVNSKTLLDWLHPIGSIYQSTDGTDPSELFGGTWERIKDLFLLAAGDTFAAGKTGGEASHTLTADEIPEIKMSYQYTGQSTVIGTDAIRLYDGDGKLNQYTGPQTSNCGGGAHNNMPPYLAVYMWKRTA